MPSNKFYREQLHCVCQLGRIRSWNCNCFNLFAFRPYNIGNSKFPGGMEHENKCNTMVDWARGSHVRCVCESCVCLCVFNAISHAICVEKNPQNATWSEQSHQRNSLYSGTCVTVYWLVYLPHRRIKTINRQESIPNTLSRATYTTQTEGKSSFHWCGALNVYSSMREELNSMFIAWNENLRSSQTKIEKFSSQ